jgi:hypothetical protein
VVLRARRHNASFASKGGTRTVGFIVIAYALTVLVWQGVTGTPPPWGDWFAAHLILIAVAVLYLGESRRAASYERIARHGLLAPGQDKDQPSAAEPLALTK